MKKLLLGIAAACLAGFTFAQDAPLWMRHSVISPDGTTIAFTYKGDIYTVPVAGGRAMQITTNPAYDTARYGVRTVSGLLLLRTVWEAWTSTLWPKTEANHDG